MAAIFIMGLIRFVLTVAEVPDNIVRYFSMSAIIAAGTLYFGIRTRSRRDRLKIAYLLILPYMIIEVAALSYTWISGQQTIFHASEYSLGTSLPVHTVGHLVGGLTWEPMFLFVAMEIIQWVRSRWFN